MGKWEVVGGLGACSHLAPLLWPKPTDFVTGPALKRGMMLQHSLTLRKEVANLEQACIQGSNMMLDSGFQEKLAEKMNLLNGLLILKLLGPDSF